MQFSLENQELYDEILSRKYKDYNVVRFNNMRPGEIRKLPDDIKDFWAKCHDDTVRLIVNEKNKNGESFDVNYNEKYD